MAKHRSKGLLIGIGGPPSDDDESDYGEGDAKEEAAESLIKAVKAGKASGVVSAFQTMQDLCSSDKESDLDEE